MSGFFPGHIAPFSESDPGNSEDIRCAQIGNTFQCGVVAWLLGQGLEATGLIPRAPFPEEIQTSFYAEVARRLSHKPPVRISLVQSSLWTARARGCLRSPSLRRPQMPASRRHWSTDSSVGLITEVLMCV